MHIVLGPKAERLANHLLQMEEGCVRRAGVCLSWHRWDDLGSGRKVITVRFAVRRNALMGNLFWGKGIYYGQIEHQGWYRHRGMWRRDPNRFNPYAKPQVQVQGQKPAPDPYPSFELVAWRIIAN